mmetsp:Transcript_75394/g.157135  ORF Transcript_75394/g.157135 Transcript_75394/m.157135 type:complete len:1109 (+) Transcript_75394:119-3445(+)
MACEQGNARKLSHWTHLEKKQSNGGSRSFKSFKSRSGMEEESFLWLDVELEGVLLIAALVGIGHEAECVLNLSRLVRQIELGLHVRLGLGHRDALDEDHGGSGSSDDEPPTLLLLLGVVRSIDRSQGSLVINFSREPHGNLRLTASIEGICVLDLVLQGDGGVAVAGPSDVHQLRLRKAIEELVSRLLVHVHDVDDVLDAHLLCLLHQLGVEVGKLHEERGVRGGSLHDHLRQLHREERRSEPAERGDDIDETQKESDSMVQDEFLIGGKISCDRTSVEVRVEEELRLSMRVAELAALNLHVERLRQGRQNGFLARAHGNGVELRGGTEDVDEAATLCGLGDAPRESLDGGVADVVVRRDKAQVRRSQLVFIFDLAAAESFETLDGVLDDLGQVIAQVLMSDTLETVVVGVLRETPVVEGPGQPINGILLVLDGLHHDLGVDVVRHTLIQVTLHGQRLINELLVVLLLRVLCEQHAHTGLINARSAGPTHHLQHVVDGVVDVSVLSAIELLGVHDDDEVGQHGHTPTELFRADEDLNGARREETLDDGALRRGEALVQETDTVLQTLLEGLLARGFQVGLHGLIVDVQKSLGLVVSCRVEEQVDGSHTGLLPIRDEDDDGLVRRVMLDGLVDRPAHRQQARRAVVNVEALNDHLERDGSDVGREVEQASASRADPLAHVPRVGQGGCQCNHSSGVLLGLGRDVSHSADDGFESRSDIGVEEVQLVNDEETDVLHDLLRHSSATHQIPLLGGGDDNVGLLEGLGVGRGVTNKFGHLEAKLLSELEAPLLESLLRGRLMRGYIDASLHGVGVGEHPEHGKLGADNLSGGRRSTDQAVVVGGVEGAERLRLNGVERLQALGSEERLGLGVAQGRERQGLQVEQFGVRRVLLGQDEMSEGDRQQSLRVDPSVGDDADEVLGRQGLGDGHGEVEGVLLFRPTLLEHEHFLVKNLLAVHILDENPEGFRSAVDLLIPLEIGGDCELDHQARPRDGLNVGAEIQLGELMDESVDGLTHLGEADQLSDLGGRQIVVSLPREVLLLDLPEDILGQALEVSEGRLGGPHPLVDHLAPVQSPERERSPASAKANLEDGSHDSAGGLLHVDHVGKEGETV